MRENTVLIALSRTSVLEPSAVRESFVRLCVMSGLEHDLAA